MQQLLDARGRRVRELDRLLARAGLRAGRGQRAGLGGRLRQQRERATHAEEEKEVQPLCPPRSFVVGGWCGRSLRSM